MPIMPRVLQIIGFLFFVILLLLLWAGLLQRVTIDEVALEPMYGVYLQHYGSYATIPSTLAEVKRYLDAQEIDTEVTFGYYLQDPKITPQSLLTSWVGVIVDEPIEIEEPFQVLTMTPDTYVHAQFQGHPYFAPFKVYGKMDEYMRRLSLDRTVPSLEVYTPHRWGQYLIDVYRLKRNLSNPEATQ